MVYGICTWCDQGKNRKVKGRSIGIIAGEVLYGICSWCKKNHMPVVCPVCRDVHPITDMLKTKVCERKYNFCCKKEACVERFRTSLPLLRERAAIKTELIQ
jgi:hypothetical protein